MGWAEFGTALDDWINKKKAYKAIDKLEADKRQSLQIGDAESRTQNWLASLSPEELEKMNASSTSNYGLPKNDFDYGTHSRDIQLKYGDVPGVDNYFKNVEDSNIKSALEDATKGMQREKQFADLQSLEEKAGLPKGDYNLRSNRQVAIDAGVPIYSGRPEVKDFAETYIEGPEKDELERDKLEKKTSSVGLGYATQMKIEAWNKIAKMPDGPEKNLEIDNYMMTFAPGTKYPLSRKGIQEATDKAAATTTGRNLAPEKLPNKTVDQLTGQQNVYANLVDVKGKFEDRFLTPYFGRGIKMAYLRQNDTDFNDFTSSLGLALNEYRRHNFGTAQTQTEIQNFLDVLNSDLNIKPEAFQKQLDNLMNSMKRDYNNKVGTRGQQRYVIPANLENIEIPNPSEQDSQNTNKTVKADDVVQILTDEEYNALSSGTVFIGPDGKKRRKP